MNVNRVARLIPLFLSAATASVYAEPVLWESDFGTEITDLTGQDDGFTSYDLDFTFTFAGEAYTDGWISSNGAIALGGLGLTYTYPGGSTFISTSDPMVAPFWSDLSLEPKGRVYQNNLAGRAVFTWEDAASFINSEASFTFQLQLLADGTIIFGYNGIDPVEGNLDTELMVGLSGGVLNDFPPEVNYTDGVVGPTESTVYERFTASPAEVFDLDQMNIVFTPVGDQYAVATITAIPEPTAIGLSLLGIGCLITRRRG